MSAVEDSFVFGFENEDKTREFDSGTDDDRVTEIDEPLHLKLPEISKGSKGLGDIQPQEKHVREPKEMSIENRLRLVEELQNAHDECIELINANDSGFPGTICTCCTVHLFSSIYMIMTFPWFLITALCSLVSLAILKCIEKATFCCIEDERGSETVREAIERGSHEKKKIRQKKSSTCVKVLKVFPFVIGGLPTLVFYWCMHAWPLLTILAIFICADRDYDADGHHWFYGTFQSDWERSTQVFLVAWFAFATIIPLIGSIITMTKGMQQAPCTSNRRKKNSKWFNFVVQDPVISMFTVSKPLGFLGGIAIPPDMADRPNFYRLGPEFLTYLYILGIIPSLFCALYVYWREGSHLELRCTTDCDPTILGEMITFQDDKYCCDVEDDRDDLFKMIVYVVGTFYAGRGYVNVVLSAFQAKWTTDPRQSFEKRQHFHFRKQSSENFWFQKDRRIAVRHQSCIPGTIKRGVIVETENETVGSGETKPTAIKMKFDGELSTTRVSIEEAIDVDEGKLSYGNCLSRLYTSLHIMVDFLELYEICRIEDYRPPKSQQFGIKLRLWLFPDLYDVDKEKTNVEMVDLAHRFGRVDQEPSVIYNQPAYTPSVSMVTDLANRIGRVDQEASILYNKRSPTAISVSNVSKDI